MFKENYFKRRTQWEVVCVCNECLHDDAKRKKGSA